MQAQKYSIKDWAEDDRPREKLLSKNPQSLSDSELVAILIGQGTPEKNVMDIAREVMLLGKNNLNELGKLPVQHFTSIKGIGPAKATVIAAALELGRRRHAGTPLARAVIRESREAALYLKSLLQDLKHEVFGVLFLNQGNRVKGFYILSQGGITATVADPRVILKRALEEEAVSLILCHNHPSGSLKPSRADEEVTLKVKEACRYFDIRLMDHIIVSEEGYYSFAEEGVI